MDILAYLNGVSAEFVSNLEGHCLLVFQEIDGDRVRKDSIVFLVEQCIDCHLDFDVLGKVVFFTGLIIGEGDFSILLMDGVNDPHDPVDLGEEFDFGFGVSSGRFRRP